jgi:hypothetical protein
MSVMCSVDEAVSETLHALAGYPSKTDWPLDRRPVETTEALLGGFDMHQHLTRHVILRTGGCWLCSGFCRCRDCCTRMACCHAGLLLSWVSTNSLTSSEFLTAT